MKGLTRWWFPISISRAADLPVYLYPDVSPSARAGEVIHILKNFSNRLSNYEGTDTLVVSVIPFFEDSFMATPTEMVSIPGDRPAACPMAGPDNEIAKLSRSYAETARRDAARQCDEFRAKARREAALQRSAEIAKLTEAIDRLSGLKLPGRCTAVNAMIRRAVRESPNGISIVVSDLENSCASQGLPTNLQRENQIFLIPVSSQQHPIEEGFDSIRSEEHTSELQ